MAYWLWIFWGFSFLGWGLERLFAAVTAAPTRRRRCMLLLPLCPVYGLAMAAVLALPLPREPVWALYLWGGVTATAVEYVYHGWMQRGLGVCVWDYSGLWGNLQGRVCLPFSLAWGFLVLPGVWAAAPALAELSRQVPGAVTWLCLLLFTADAVCSLRFLAVTHDLQRMRDAPFAPGAGRRVPGADGYAGEI